MKRGYTLILTVLFISIGLTAITFLLNTSFSRARTYNKNLDIVQADYVAESAVNVILGNDNFTEKITNVVKKGRLENKVRFFEEQINVFDVPVNIKISLPDIYSSTPDNDYFEVEAKTKYENIDAKWYGYGSVVNPIYKKRIAVISPRTFPDEQNEESIYDYDDILITGNMKYIELPDEDIYVSKKTANSTKLTFYRQVEENLVPFYDVEYINLYIKQTGGSLTVIGNTLFNGILEIKQINLDENAKLNGILKLMSDINASGNYNIEVNGIVINVDQVSENYLNANYNYEQLRKFHMSIKNFIKPSIVFTSKEKKY